MARSKAVQVKHLGRRELLRAVALAIPLSRTVFDILRERHPEWPFKVVERALDKLVDEDVIEYGVSLNYPWLTDSGMEELAACL